jgi:hypothetical protein
MDYNSFNKFLFNAMLLLFILRIFLHIRSKDYSINVYAINEHLSIC